MENLMTEVNRITRRFGLVALVVASLISCAASGNRDATPDQAGNQPLPQTTAAGVEQPVLPE